MNPRRQILVVTFSCFFTWTQDGLAADPERKIDFGREIRPILNENCVECHGGVQQAADLSFIHREAALSVIEPGAPDDSYLMERVRSKDESEVMPPPEHGPPLSEDQIAVLERWIEQGAEWRQPWAYERPVAPAIPQNADDQWSNNPIDRFVLARLQEESIKPAAKASPEQWLRRVWLDLTGLPPGPEDHDAFLRDVAARGDLAYQRVVNQLLASPAFGERWASVWLDQIRYADSRGLGLDGRREIWKYRDWVIDAINQDMPFDEFTIKQIAGDLLPDSTIGDLVATAANRLTQTNEEGGTDDEEFRVNAVLDRVSTVWQTWQGITFGCVQCHSHPYDPIQHEEFYQFAAFFNNTADCDLSEDLPLLRMPVDPNDEPRASRLDEQIRSLEKSTWRRESKALQDDFAGWRPIDELSAEANKATKIDVEQRGDRTEFFTTDTLSSGTQITLTANLPEGLQSLSALRLTIAPRNVESALRDSEWGFVLSHVHAELVEGNNEPQTLRFSRVIGDEPHPFKDPDQSLNAKSSEGFAAYSRIHYPRQAVFVLESPLRVREGSKLILRLENRVTLLGAFPLVARRGSLDATDQPGIGELLANEGLQRDRERLEQLRSERRAIPSSLTPVTRERPDHLTRPTHVFIRGLFLTKDKQVQPAVPAAFPPLSEELPPNRLALARWLVSESNPLTARVLVNRVWARVFGVGIVATEEDFGTSGELPSHPALLDYLATRFQGIQDWSLKSLIKSIVLSSTYRQDAVIRPDLHERDPQNRLLARGPRFRMPAEMVRDNALAVSGLLSTKMHGRPVHPPIPDGIWKPFQGGDKWVTPGPESGDRYRRSIYTYTKRSIPYPMFAAFDAPSREFCTPRRLRSNTPIQALMTLNDTTFVECSRALADRMAQSGQDLEAQIRYGFLAVACRRPSETEVGSLMKLYRTCISEGASPGDGMDAIATVLLNLDEITSK